MIAETHLTPMESQFVFLGLMAFGWLLVVVAIDYFVNRRPRNRRLSKPGGTWAERLIAGGSLSWRDHKGRRL